MLPSVAAGVALYERIGFAWAFRKDREKPKYAGVRRDDVELHLKWHDTLNRYA